MLNYIVRICILAIFTSTVATRCVIPPMQIVYIVRYVLFSFHSWFTGTPSIFPIGFGYQMFSQSCLDFAIFTDLWSDSFLILF
jgi:hypothetical protein